MSKGKKALIAVRVQPNASRSEVLDFKEGVLRLKIAAPPVKGKANRELTRFLGDVMKISKSSLTIERGITGRNKVVGFSGLTQSRVIEQLDRLVSGKRECEGRGQGSRLSNNLPSGYTAFKTENHSEFACESEEKT